MAKLKIKSKLNIAVEKAVKDIEALKIPSNVLYKATRRIYDRKYNVIKNVKKGRSKNSGRKAK